LTVPLGIPPGTEALGEATALGAEALDAAALGLAAGLGDALDPADGVADGFAVGAFVQPAANASRAAATTVSCACLFVMSASWG
jgi:hypothetical protein